MKLLIVGDPRKEHVGSHLRHAAAELGIACGFADVRVANGGRIPQALSWRLGGRRPARLHAFSRELIGICANMKPEMVLTTGIAPVSGKALERIGKLGVRRVNLLTDDPFNPAHRAPWFMRALPHYDQVFSTRRANIEQLKAARCRNVAHLPFGYAPQIHFEPPISDERRSTLDSDVVFAGGADEDRVPYIAALDRAGLRVGLYGGYWERYAETQHLTRGLKPPRVVSEAVASAKIALCLVRRANRDGSCMRTFEVAAIGAAMLVEKTTEHVELFGYDGQHVMYFASIPEMVEKAKLLLGDSDRRTRLRAAVRRLIVEGGHTYRDRLATILKIAA